MAFGIRGRRSDPLSRTTTPPRCSSWIRPAVPAPSFVVTDPTPRPWFRSAAVWTVWRWPSSWRPRVWPCCRSSRSRRGLTISFALCGGARTSPFTSARRVDRLEPRSTRRAPSGSRSAGSECSPIPFPWPLQKRSWLNRVTSQPQEVFDLRQPPGRQEHGQRRRRCRWRTALSAPGDAAGLRPRPGEQRRGAG